MKNEKKSDISHLIRKPSKKTLRKWNLSDKTKKLYTFLIAFFIILPVFFIFLYVFLPQEDWQIELENQNDYFSYGDIEINEEGTIVAATTTGFKGYNSNGELLWTHDGEGYINDEWKVPNLMINEDGDYFVACLKGYVSEAPLYLAKYNSDWDLQFNKTIDSGYGSFASVMDEDSNIYLAAMKYEDLYIYKFDKNGNQLWSTTAVGTRAAGIIIRDSLYISATFSEKPTVIKYSKDGSFESSNEVIVENVINEDRLIISSLINGPDGELYLNLRDWTNEDTIIVEIEDNGRFKEIIMQLDYIGSIFYRDGFMYAIKRISDIEYSFVKYSGETPIYEKTFSHNAGIQDVAFDGNGNIYLIVREIGEMYYLIKTLDQPQATLGILSLVFMILSICIGIVIAVHIVNKQTAATKKRYYREVKKLNELSKKGESDLDVIAEKITHAAMADDLKMLIFLYESCKDLDTYKNYKDNKKGDWEFKDELIGDIRNFNKLAKDVKESAKSIKKFQKQILKRVRKLIKDNIRPGASVPFDAMKTLIPLKEDIIKEALEMLKEKGKLPGEYLEEEGRFIRDFKPPFKFPERKEWDLKDIRQNRISTILKHVDFLWINDALYLLEFSSRKQFENWLQSFPEKLPLVLIEDMLISTRPISMEG